MSNRTLIQQHSTGIIKGLMGQVGSIKGMDHDATKGQLREMFVSNVLNRYLSSQFGVGSGAIVNQRGEQSSQTDIIIYDKRIIPPFIWEQPLGVFPIEAVVETIEVKSWLGLPDILAAVKAAQKLRQIATVGSIYDGDVKSRMKPPGTTVIGFFENGLGELRDESSGHEWLVNNTSNVWGICHVGGFSWMKVGTKQIPWALVLADEYAEETKRYIAVILDNARTKAERNYHSLEFHRDWIGVYTRDNPRVKQHFEDRANFEGSP